MKQCSTYAGTAQPYLLAGNLRHSDGVHDVRFARQAAHSLVGLPCEVEGFLYYLGMLAVTRLQVGIYQMLVSRFHHTCVFLFSACHLLHNIRLNEVLYIIVHVCARSLLLYPG